MRWFRLYSEARNDAKLRSLTAEQFRVWFNLLCLAGEQDDRGAIAAEDTELLALEVADADTALLDATIARLVKLRIVAYDGARLAFLHWDARQYDKPSDTAEQTRERQRRHRAKTPPVTPSLEVSRDVTPGHALLSRYTEQSRTEQSSTAPPIAVAPPVPAWAARAWAGAMGAVPCAAGFDRWVRELAPDDEAAVRQALAKANAGKPRSLIALARTMFHDPPEQTTGPPAPALPDADEYVADLKRRGPMQVNGKRKNDP